MELARKYQDGEVWSDGMGWGEGGGMFEVMGWKEEWAGTGAQGDVVSGGERRAI